MLETGNAWLQAQRKASMAKTVTYRRGAASVAVQATIGQTAFDIDQGDGAPVAFQSRDYLITVADLVLSAALAIPQEGDTIEETVTVGAVTTTYKHEVARFGAEECYRYSDPYRITFRIHTKLMTETAV